MFNLTINSRGTVTGHGRAYGSYVGPRLLTAYWQRQSVRTALLMDEAPLEPGN